MSIKNPGIFFLLESYLYDSKVDSHVAQIQSKSNQVSLVTSVSSSKFTDLISQSQQVDYISIASL